MRATSALLACLLALAALAALVRMATRPPEALPATSDPAGFSAERAVDALVAAVGPVEPRPLGSVAHTRAREGLVRVLEAMGAAVEVKDELLHVGTGELVRVRNVVGRVEGGAGADTEGPALVLASHYDSVAAGPGAADAGSGVATLLEVVRALRVGPPLRHDLVVLLTDGEELGLYGARAFVGSRARWEPLGAVINVEARGTGGPSLVFEVGPGPGYPDLLRALPHPQSTSVAAEVYRRMPNDTDYSVFRDAGLVGYNLAFIEGWEGYHAPFDDLRHLDHRAVQHHGENTLALLRALDAAELESWAYSPREGGGDDPVFTDLFGRWMLVFPRARLPVLAAAAGLLALLPLVARRVPALGALASLLAHLGGLTVGVLLASVPGVLLTLVSPGSGPWHPTAALVLGSSVTLGALGMFAAHRPGAETIPGRARAVALAVLLSAGGAALVGVAPGAAHLLLLPGLVVAGLALRGEHPLAALLASLALGVVLLPVAWALPGVVGVLLPGVAALPVLLTLAPLAPLVAALPRPAWRALGGTVGAIGLVALAAVAILPPFDERSPGTTVARIDASGVTLVGQGRAGELVGISPADLSAVLPAPRLACTRVGPAWEVEVLPPVGGVDVTLGVGEAGPGARLAWGPHGGELGAGAWTLVGVGVEGVRLTLPGDGAVALPVKVVRRGVLADALGVNRGEAQVPRGAGDRATWEGVVRCPSSDTGPMPTVRPGSEPPPSAPRLRRRG